MPAQIEIGTTTHGQCFPIEIEELSGTRLLLMGNSGSGKLHLLRWGPGQSAGLVRQVVIDSEGDISSLEDEFEHIVIDRAAHFAPEIEASTRRVQQHSC